jgi:hypothetical protein
MSERTEEEQENFGYGSLAPDPDLNTRPSEYEAYVLTTGP